MFIIYSIIFAILICLAYVVGKEIYSKNIHIWLVSWLKGNWRESYHGNGPTHILFCFVDHYEPQWNNPDRNKENKRVERWCNEYPKMARRHKDSDNNYPIHTFFYPEEEYREEHLDKLAELCKKGFGEIEIHLHHDNDTEAGLKKKLERFIRNLHNKHGALAFDNTKNKPVFAFIHGNWALDNSRKDGRWCGINNELIVLDELGCYADFTLPSAPSDTQTKKINSIYYAKDNPEQPKSHNTGVDVQVGLKQSGDLMIIQGPLALNWKNRKWGIFPKIENADIRKTALPTHQRIDLWIKTAVHVKGRPEWKFIKVHTHGTKEDDIDTLLGEPVDAMFSYLEEKYNDGKHYILHYVSAREMYNIVKAAEAEESGNPATYRDYIYSRPKNCSMSPSTQGERI